MCQFLIQPIFPFLYDRERIVKFKDDNQYCDTDLFIETRYCYEYAAREEVLLNVTDSSGPNVPPISL